DTLPAGSVISQSPVAGTQVNVGSAVNLVVSTGAVTAAISIWNNAAVPAVPWYSDPTPVSLGLKFRSDTAGTITGIRFYKGTGNNGTHIGSLYSSTGTLLGQATFSGETASGWQQVSFSTAVPIAANTTYVAAFFSNAGFPY